MQMQVTADLACSINLHASEPLSWCQVKDIGSHLQVWQAQEQPFCHCSDCVDQSFRREMICTSVDCGLKRLLFMACQQLPINAPKKYRPGKVVILGSHSLNCARQYCCVCPMWNGSSCVAPHLVFSSNLLSFQTSAAFCKFSTSEHSCMCSCLKQDVLAVVVQAAFWWGVSLPCKTKAWLCWRVEQQASSPVAGQLHLRLLLAHLWWLWRGFCLSYSDQVAWKLVPQHPCVAPSSSFLTFLCQPIA